MLGNFTYCNPTKLYFGKGAVENLRTELPGYGKNVLLVNSMPVIGGSTLLHNYDRITIGTTQLIFVALCGEQFSWNSEERDHA